ncbi:Rib/alpha-like domain-containing protein, partial [Streptococcus hyovaginalis]
MHDVLVKDTTANYGFPGDVVDNATGGLFPQREYQIQWFRDGVKYGEPVTVTSDVNGLVGSVPLTVPDDLTGETLFTSAVFEQGESTDSLSSSLAADSFLARIPVAESLEPSYEDKVVTPGNAATSEPAFTDADGNPTTAPADATYAIPDTFTAPAGYTVSIAPDTGVVTVTAADGTTVETLDVPVTVTYVDGSTDSTTAKFLLNTDGDGVTDTTDADKNTPEGKDQTVNVGETPKAEDSISNLPDLPDGTTVEFKDPIDTTTPGEKDGTVVVTYPDGSTDEVPVKVTVTDPRTDADKNTPEGKDQTVNVGETPKAEDSISNLPDLPDGTTVEFK